MRSKRRWVAVPALALAILGGPGLPSAGAEDGTGVTTLDAEAAGAGWIEVSGTASFVDVPTNLGTDPSGDADIGVPPSLTHHVQAGVDLQRATLARPDPFSDELLLRFEVWDPLPAVSAPPESWLSWTVPEICTVRAGRTWLLNAQSPSPVPVFMGCGAEDGRWEEDVIEVEVPVATFPTGFVPSAGNPVWTGLVAPGVPSTQADRMTLEADYLIPEPSVRVGLAPMGTPVWEVPLTSAAQVTEDGSFSGLVDGGSLSPGEYVVVAEACYGQGNCGLGYTTITI